MVFPLFLGLRDVLVLAAAFGTLLIWTRRGRWHRSVREVDRPARGAPLLPVGLNLAALLTWSPAVAFTFGVLMVAFGGPAARLVGARAGGPGWRVPGGQETVAGSAALFLVSLALELGFGLGGTGTRPRMAVLVATALAGIEGMLGWGTVNAVLPVMAAELGERFLGL